MSAGKNILIVDPGIIGWNVLDHLVREGCNITGLVVRASHGQQIQSSAAKAVIEDLNDADFIKTRSLKSDIILHTAIVNHKPGAEAVCQGVAERACVWNDNTRGEFKSVRIYHDNNRSEIDSVLDDVPHRRIDLTVLKYQEDIGDKAQIAVMIPPLIYGYNPQHRRLIIQILTLTRFAKKHGFAGYVGKGLLVESQIHALDLAQAFVTLLHHMEHAPPPGSLLTTPTFPARMGMNPPGARLRISSAMGSTMPPQGWENQGSNAEDYARGNLG